MDSILGLPSVSALSLVINEFQADPSTYRSRELLPVEPEYTPEDIEWDAYGAVAGMTKAHVMDSDPQVIDFPVVKHYKEKTAFWKEASILDESTLMKVKMLGTFNQRAGKQLISKRLEQHNYRLETRIEWANWQALFGTLTINENNVKRTIDYLIPGANKPSVFSTVWSDDAADIIGDLRTLANLFRTNHTGAGNPTVWINSTQLGWILVNDAILAAVSQSPALMGGGVSAILNYIKVQVGNISGFEVYDGEYTDDSGNYTKFIPDEKILLVGKGPAGEKFGAFKTTLSLHNGTIDSPQPGKFAFYKDETRDELNPKVIMGAGIYGIPVIYHPSWLVIGTVDS